MITPFINFTGRCGEAIAFYETVFKVTDKNVMRFGDLPPNADAPVPAEVADYVLHAEMTINGTQVWLGDTIEGGITAGDMVSLTVMYDAVEDVKAAYDKLMDGGKARIEISPTFYSPMYGMVEDKFGVVWSVICRQPT